MAPVLPVCTRVSPDTHANAAGVHDTTIDEACLSWDLDLVGKLNEQVLGVLWLLSTCKEGADALASEEAVSTIVDVISKSYKFLNDAQYLVISVVHAAARAGSSGTVRVLLDKQIPLCLHLVALAKDRMPVSFRLSAIRCLLLLYSKAPAAVDEQLSRVHGQHPLPNLLLTLLSEPSRLMQRHVTAIMAAVSSGGKGCRACGCWCTVANIITPCQTARPRF